MKKLLSILAAVGLSATASTAVVACTTTVKAKDAKADETFKNVDLAKDKKAADLKAEMFDITVKNGDKDVTKDVTVTLSFEKGKKDSQANIKVSVDATNLKNDKKVTLKVEVKSNDKAKDILKKSFDQKFDVKVEAAKKADDNNGGDKPAATDNSKVTISKAAISKDGTAITLTTDKLVKDVEAKDVTVSGAEVKSVEGKKDSTTITITLNAAAKSDAKITVSAYASKDVAVDMSAMKGEDPKPAEKTNADISIKSAVVDAAGTTITVTLDSKLVAAVTDADVTLDGATKDGAATGIDKDSDTITVKVTEALTKDSKVTVKIAGLKDAAKGMAVDVSAIAPATL